MRFSPKNEISPLSAKAYRKVEKGHTSALPSALPSRPGPS
jgi:hypothetical protein